MPAAFNDDVERNGGYAYTTEAPLSSRMANQRLTAAYVGWSTFGASESSTVGCGDGTYTVELYDRARPAFVQGIDPAEAAIVGSPQSRRHAADGVLRRQCL